MPHSTPIKKSINYEVDLKGIEKEKHSAVIDQMISSNLGLIVGDISEIDIPSEDDYFGPSTQNWRKDSSGSNNEQFQEPFSHSSKSSAKPSTLNLSDLESIISEPIEVSLSRSFANMKQ